MSLRCLEIRELAAWDFDDPIYPRFLAPEELRSAACGARRRVEEREPYREESPVCVELSRRLMRELARRKQSVADSGEFDGLAWELAVVDLRRLIAFQRRIGFTNDDHFEIEHGAEWQQLLDLALPVPPPCRSPYMEVASYRGRWLLRDGYHRSFRLLRRGIHLVPAVVVHAETLVEMGAVGSQFFAEEILFSSHPPMVADFVDDEMIVRYLRRDRERIAEIFHEAVQTSCDEGEGV